MKINELSGMAYIMAIDNVIDILNRELDLKLFTKRDMAHIDKTCEKLGIEFDAKGNIVK